MTEETNKEKKKRLKAERKAKAMAKQKQEQVEAKAAKKVVEEKAPEPVPLKRVFSTQAGALATAIKTGDATGIPNVLYSAKELQPLFETLAEYKNDVIQPITWAKGYIHAKQMEKSRIMDTMMWDLTFWEKYVTKRAEYAELQKRWNDCNNEIWRGKRKLANAELHMFRTSLKMQEHFMNL